MLNRVILIGKVQRAEVHFTVDGKLILSITLRTWDSPETQFHRLVYFDREGKKAYRYAEILNSPDFDGYLLAEGQIRYRTYTAKDGTTRKFTEIVVDRMRLISPVNGKNLSEKSETSEKEEMEPLPERTPERSTEEISGRMQEKPLKEDSRSTAKSRMKEPELEDIVTPEIEEIERELEEVDRMDLPF